MNKKYQSIIICISTFCVFTGIVITAYSLGLKHKTIIVYPNLNEVTYEVSEGETKYPFMPAMYSDYITAMCAELKIDSDLVVSILLQENSQFDPEIVNQNKDGTFDLGLFQLNDKWLWRTFEPSFWKFDINFDPFNWKHNAFLAMHLIRDLTETLKIEEEVIAAYNCGTGRVMNNSIPESTKRYVCAVKNNLRLLRG